MIGLGQAKGTLFFEAGHQWEPALLLFFGTQHRDGGHGETRGGAKDNAKTGIGTRQFVQNEAGGYGAHTGTAEALDATAGDFEGANLGNQPERNVRMLPIVVDDRDDLPVTEGTHFVSNAAFLLSEEFINQIEIRS